jgi:hypothetical protein
VWPFLAYDARCLLIVLEVISDKRIVASTLFAREIVAGRVRVDCADLALILRFEKVPYSRRRNSGLLPFFHRTNYDRFEFEPVSNAIINLNKNCHWLNFIRNKVEEIKINYIFSPIHDFSIILKTKKN